MLQKGLHLFLFLIQHIGSVLFNSSDVIRVHNAELHGRYFSGNIIRMIGVRWAGHTFSFVEYLTMLSAMRLHNGT